MEKHYKLAVVGATGLVGETFLELLSDRHFPVSSLYLLASERSDGITIFFKKEPLRVTHVEDFDFSTVDIAFFFAGEAVSKKYAVIAEAAGAIVIDNSAFFRYRSDIPLIIPEINPEALVGHRVSNIIANPNCSTIQMLIALKPIYDAVGICRVNVATYQSVSGAGKQSLEELVRQTAQLLSGQTVSVSCFPKQIAFNVLPHIDSFEDNGYTREEMKMVWETRRILDDQEIKINATAVRVPVFFGHSEALHLETQRTISPEEVISLLKAAPGLTVLENTDYPTAITHAASQDHVFVGRVRKDLSHPNGINLWVVSDNVRKGAALNAIQIAEMLISNQLCLH